MATKLIIWDFDGVVAQTSDNWAEKGYPLTEGVRDILAIPDLKHCIATNGTLEQTLEKIALCGLGDVFSEDNIFTIDMVGVGKSSPDIFVLAMQKMGAKPENTFIIDNLYTAMRGAIKAGCLPISFLNHNHFNNQEWIQRLQYLGVKHIFCTMKDVENLINILQ